MESIRSMEWKDSNGNVIGKCRITAEDHPTILIHRFQPIRISPTQPALDGSDLWIPFEASKQLSMDNTVSDAPCTGLVRDRISQSIQQHN
jgi:hypothetical protein